MDANWPWAVLAVIAIVGSGGAGVYSMLSSNSGLQHVAAVTAGVRDQMQADMMHDALRADVLMAIHVGPGGAAEDQQNVRADVADHVKSFEGSIADLAAFGLSPEIGKALDDVRPALTAYAAAAQSITDKALTKSVRRRSRFSGLCRGVFRTRRKMATLGDLVQETTLQLPARRPIPTTCCSSRFQSSPSLRPS